MKLLAFAASHRRESINRKLLNVACQAAQQTGASVDVADYGEFDSPIYDDETFTAGEFPPAVLGFIRRLESAHGVLLASPEYNWSFPGSLKNLIDWASVHKPSPFARKPVLLMSATPSLRGGAQGLVQLRTPLSALGAFVFPRLFTLSRAEEALASGAFQDLRLQEEMVQLIEDYFVFAKAVSA